MSLFRPNYSKPGPGIEPDEPRKKGLARYFELLGSHSGELAKVSAMLFACRLPALAVFVLAVIKPAWLPYLIALAVPAALPTGGAAVAACFCVSQMLRDEPAYAGHEFKRILRENLRPAAPFGVAFTLLAMAQGYTLLLFLASGGGSAPVAFLALWLLSVLLAGMIGSYFWLQTAYLSLRPLPALKNSLLLAFIRLPRSLAGAAFGHGALALVILFWPFSTPLLLFLPLLGAALSLLPAQMWLWPVIDSQFGIEDALRKREAERNAGSTNL